MNQWEFVDVDYVFVEMELGYNIVDEAKKMLLSMIKKNKLCYSWKIIEFDLKF